MFDFAQKERKGRERADIPCRTAKRPTKNWQGRRHSPIVAAWKEGGRASERERGEPGKTPVYLFFLLRKSRLSSGFWKVANVFILEFLSSLKSTRAAHRTGPRPMSSRTASKRGNRRPDYASWSVRFVDCRYAKEKESPVPLFFVVLLFERLLQIRASIKFIIMYLAKF